MFTQETCVNNVCRQKVLNNYIRTYFQQFQTFKIFSRKNRDLCRRSNPGMDYIAACLGHFVELSFESPDFLKSSCKFTNFVSLLEKQQKLTTHTDYCLFLKNFPRGCRVATGSNRFIPRGELFVHHLSLPNPTLPLLLRVLLVYFIFQKISFRRHNKHL